MTHYIAFLRGINVSGKKSLKMQLLKDAFTQNGFADTQTYIQSGNIFIPNCELNKKSVKIKIEKILLTEFDIETICIIKTANELETILNNIPFSIENTKQLYFTFTETTIDKELIKTIAKGAYKEDLFSASNDCIYIQCINGFGKTKLNNNFFERKLKCKATTRNWNTLVKMIHL